MRHDLETLIAATNGIHAVDPSRLVRLDATTARRLTRANATRRCDTDASRVCFFSTHEAYEITHARDDLDDDDDDSRAARNPNNVVHVFTLRADVREALVSTLVPLALAKRRRGREDAERALGEAIPGPGSDVSVVRSNRGGYQSYADLLDSSDDEDDADDARDADGADDAVDAVDAVDADARRDGRERASPHRTDTGTIDDALTRPSWTSITDIALDAYAHVRDARAQRADVGSRDVYGWLNVNAPGDYNALHAHDSADRWSGVVYLAVPKRDRDVRDAGCLGVRAASDASDASDSASRPYFVHAPTVGDVVVFTGAALHAVSAFTRLDGPDDDDDDFDDFADDAFADNVASRRVSVAFNIDA